MILVINKLKDFHGIRVVYFFIALEKKVVIGIPRESIAPIKLLTISYVLTLLKKDNKKNKQKTKKKLVLTL